MKIVLFTAGLGNQIFQYFFCQYLKDKYPKETVYGCYDKAILNNHNGLEIQNVFDVELPPSSTITHAIVRIIRAIYKRTGWKWLESHDESQRDTLYYEGYWHNKQLFSDYLSALRFKANNISVRNQDTLAAIGASNSVSIHVRRGDYLDPIRSKDFANSCPISYYEEGMKHALSVFPDAKFFVFSDDIAWVKGNLAIPNATFIDWNQGKDSFWDMYMMSKCRASIIANSSFSYWGAVLGQKKAFVVKPKKWIGNEIPDIFPDNWISI